MILAKPGPLIPRRNSPDPPISEGPAQSPVRSVPRERDSPRTKNKHHGASEAETNGLNGVTKETHPITSNGSSRKEVQVEESQNQAVAHMNFDALIYGQPGASAPPPGLILPEKDSSTAKIQSKEEPHFAHLDPRLHWPQVHSQSWYNAKQEEIKARGGRKANFGRAAERMREQRLKEKPVSFEDNLPDDIKSDANWVQALKSFNDQKPVPERNPRLAQKRNTKQVTKRNGQGTARKSAYS
jgi:hypothetical protein